MPAPVTSPSTAKAHSRKRRERALRNYTPLLILVSLAALVAVATQTHRGGWDFREWMLDAMGFFLVMFAMLKLFDVSGFAEGFRKYDLLAGRVRTYGLVYPFIECALGLGYLARWQLHLLQTATVVIMTFGALGVINALRNKLKVDCACLGTVLKVPLSTVALTEDLGMAAMAATLLLRLG